MKVALVVYELAYNSHFHGEVWGEEIDAIGIKKTFENDGISCEIITTNIIKYLQENDPSALKEYDLAIHFYWPTIMLRNCKNILFFQQYYDDKIFAKASKHFHEFDLVMTNAATIAKEHNLKYFPLAVDLPSFKNSVVKDNFLCDISFIGNTKMRSDKTYERFLKPAKQFNLNIYGHGWEEEHYKEYHKYYKGRLDIEEMPHVYKSSKLVLCIHNDEYVTRFGLVTNRIFHVLAAGSILISDPHPDLVSMFKDGEGVVYTKGFDDLNSIISNLLKNPQLRKEIYNKGIKKLESEHTWKHRLRNLEILKELKTDEK